MATMDEASVYALFASLPPASAQPAASGDAPSSSALAAASVKLPDVSPILDFAAKSDEDQKKSLDFARSVVAEYEAWYTETQEKEAQRDERREIMRIAVSGEKEKASARNKSKKDELTPRTKNKRVSEVMQATGLEAERCKFFLNLKEWKVQDAITSIHDLGAASPKQEETTNLMFELPGGQKVTEQFKISQGCFDVYAKAYQLIKKQDEPFKMALSGPGVPDQDLDESTWSNSLSSVGVTAGRTYTVWVMQ
mmetsp:Transcript_56281/g.131873  ORF Transcript_56281/g.131873 Transcript_56281/m.131873 type:complete len:252 (-) Transcript_56281:80-835(-)